MTTKPVCPICGRAMTVLKMIQYEDGEHLAVCDHCEGVREAATMASGMARKLLDKARGPRCAVCDALLDDTVGRMCPSCEMELTLSLP